MEDTPREWHGAGNKDYENMTKEELIEELEKLQSPNWARDADGLNSVLDDLRVHQVELEMQNRELREAQQELEESRNRYADLYDFAPVGYASLDDKGVILDINLTGSSMLGVERGVLIGMPLARYVCLEDRGLFIEHMHRCELTEEKTTTELKLIAKDGAVMCIELSSNPSVEVASGSTVYRTVITDITVRKQLDDELRSKNEELEAFAHTISHELRSSLSVVEGFGSTAMAAHERRDGREELNSLEHMFKGVRRAQRYIESLLQYAGAVHSLESISRVETEEVLMEVLNDYGEEITEKAIEIVVSGDLPPIMADAIGLQQVFRNLVGNALKYKSQNLGPRIEINAERKGDEVTLCVADNGVGIPPEAHLQIFEPFKRFNAGGERGLGIGLATVKRMVEAWGGRVWVESQPEEGATFFFTAPAAV